MPHPRPRQDERHPQPELVMFATRLLDARNFVEIGLTVCTMSRQIFGLDRCAISLLAPDGRPVIAVDNEVVPDAEVRLADFEQRWRLDPVLRELRHRHVARDTELEQEFRVANVPRQLGDAVDTLTLPILALSQLIGTIRCTVPPLQAQRNSLCVLSLHVSVRLAQLGITQSATDEGLDSLTARQLDVARLTVQGYSNVEIATLLDVSVNTIKKHLGHVFERLQVTNRTELAGRSLGPMHRDGLPDGVTRIGECTVIKSVRAPPVTFRLRPR